MFYDDFFSYLQFFIIGILLFLSVSVKSDPFVFVPVNAGMSFYRDQYGENALEQFESGMCPFSGLREAMVNEQMAQIVADTNVFQTIEHNDVVRLQKGVGLYWVFNPLRAKIYNIYEDFYKIAHLGFTLNITVYPSEVKEDTCLGYSTIIKTSTLQDGQKKIGNLEKQLQNSSETLDVHRDISGVFGEYLAVEGKKPRHFELRKNQSGDMVVCEASRSSLEERVNLYCDGSDIAECKRQTPPLCSEWDEGSSEVVAGGNVCSSLNIFEKIFGSFLLRNKTMKRFCPNDCSYYVQFLHELNQEKDGNCVESHAIIHCGPKKTEARYNLNIKVVDNFCKDFNVMCIPDDQAVQL